MPVSTEALKKWAAGISSGAKTEAELDAPPANAAIADDDDDDEGEDEEPLEPGEENPLWAGTDDRDDFADMEDAEAEEFCDWLSEREPDLYACLLQLADGALEGDEPEMDVSSEQLLQAEQYLAPEYPEFDQGQREATAAGVREYVPTYGVPKAIAMSVAEARKGAAGGDEDDDSDEESDDEETAPPVLAPKKAPAFAAKKKPTALKPGMTQTPPVS